MGNISDAVVGGQKLDVVPDHIQVAEERQARGYMECVNKCFVWAVANPAAAAGCAISCAF